MKETDLPNDIEELKKLVLKLSGEVIGLKDTILYLQRKKFGPQSEKSKDPNQSNLFNELEDIIENNDSEEKETITYERKKKAGRKGITEELPRVEEIHDLSEEEKVGMKYIGDEICEKLEITPAKVFVRRIIRRRYAPIGDGSFKVAPGPLELLPKTMASASLLAYIITSKYCDALPLYRQEKIFERVHAELSRQTMANWLIKLSDKLIPLYNLLQELALSSPYLQMDETRIQVLKEKGKKPSSKSFMWVRFRPGDSPIVLFDYSPTRSGEVPIKLLEGFKGYLQVDGYDGYARVCELYQLIRVGCWDHCRRKFYDALKSSNGKGIGKKAIDQIKRIYKIEEEIRHLSPEEKKQIRNEKSKPLLIKFKEWIDELRSKLTPSSIAGKAVNYAFNEWSYLIRYLDDGQINISNAWVENAIRPFCIGRKNWMFSNSVQGAEASAMFYSLVETAKQNGLEPFEYLSKMLDKLPHAQTVEDFERLLPLKGQFLA